MISVEEFLARTGIPVPPADNADDSAMESSAADPAPVVTEPDVGSAAPASEAAASADSTSADSRSAGVASYGVASFGSVGSESRGPVRFGAMTGERTRRGRGRSRRAGSRGQRELGDDEARDVDMCQEAALTLLDAAARSTGAMKERLARKGYAPETIATVISNLTRVGLLNDESYAEDAVRYCLTRCMGRRGTVAELVRKGVDRHLADRVTRQAEEQGLFVDSAYRLGRQVAGRTEGLDRAVRLRRFWSAGGRKGHSPADLRAVVDDGVFDDA